MLGSGLGKKVTADVVKNEYNEFLEKKNAVIALRPKAPTKEERRAEMRRRGIFVMADDTENDYTIMEKIGVKSCPYIAKMVSKPLRWKKDVIRRSKTTKDKHKEKEEKKPDSTGDTSTSDAKKPKKKKSDKPVGTAEAHVVDTSDKKIKDDKDKKGAEAKKEVEKQPSDTETALPIPVDELATAATASAESADVATAIEATTTATASAESADVATAIEATTTATATSRDPKVTASPNASGNRGVGRSPSERSLTPSAVERVERVVPKMESQGNVFEKLDEDESQLVQGHVAHDEKATIALARKLLKLAKKLKVFDQCLTQQENDVLAKFFSGKSPLNQEVLKVLDVALDKTIDVLQKNNIDVDEETRGQMKERGKLKAAIMGEILVSPQFLPKTWTQKYEEWKSEAEKQKHGINWFRILFTYPKHKSFGDGPEDNTGNFKRKERGLLLGCLLGPSNSKSFDETRKDELAKGMFLDTRLIEDAKIVGTTPSSTSTAIRKA